MKQDDKIEEIILKLNGLIKLQEKNGLIIGECLERIDRLDKWIGFKKNYTVTKE